MSLWEALQQIVLQVAARATEIFYLPVFWLAVLIVAIQSWTQQKNQQLFSWNLTNRQNKQAAYTLSAFLSQISSVLQVILATILIGWVGGIVASVLLVFLGVTIEMNLLLQLWSITLLLMFCGKRFICFAYAGGILTLLQYWLYGNYAAGQQILMLVAVLHFAEAILVFLSGTIKNEPVYLRDKTGKTTTGVQMQMTWPIPLVIPERVTYSAQAAIIQAEYLYMPDWWPIFSLGTGETELMALYQLIPMLAAIGYFDQTGNNVQRRIHATSARLLLYSILLGSIVILSCKLPILVCAAAMVSIIGHEVIIRM